MNINLFIELVLGETCLSLQLAFICYDGDSVMEFIYGTKGLLFSPFFLVLADVRFSG